MPLDPTAYSATLQPLRYSEPGDVIIKRRLPSADTFEEVALESKVDGFPVMDANGQMATLTLAQMQSKLSVGEAAVTSVAGRTGAVTLTKTDVGLDNVNNTSDADKPVSTAQQTALNDKQKIEQSKSANFTAVAGESYVTTATLTVTDPASPTNGQSYSVRVSAGTSTVGGTAYAVAKSVITRSYNAGAWSNNAGESPALTAAARTVTRTAFVDLSGDNATAVIGNPAKPYLTAQAAYDALKVLASANPALYYLLKTGVGLGQSIILTSNNLTNIIISGAGSLASGVILSHTAPDDTPCVSVFLISDYSVGISVVLNGGVGVAGNATAGGNIELHRCALSEATSRGGYGSGMNGGGNGGTVKLVDCDSIGLGLNAQTSSIGGIYDGSLQDGGGATITIIRSKISTIESRAGDSGIGYSSNGIVNIIDSHIGFVTLANQVNISGTSYEGITAPTVNFYDTAGNTPPILSDSNHLVPTL